MKWCLLYFIMYFLDIDLSSASGAQGYMTANGRRFNATYREYVYEYIDGEGTNFECKIAGSSVRLLFQLAEEHHKLEQIATVSMYVKLTAAVHNTTLSCTFSDEQNQPAVTLRFILNKYKPVLLAIQVNGLIPPSYPNVKENSFLYKYKYYDSESLTLNFIRDGSMNETAYCTVQGQNAPYQFSKHFNNSYINLDETVKYNFWEGQTGTYLTFRSRHNNGTLYLITVEFALRIPHYNPYMNNLPMPNILVEYTNPTGSTIIYDIGDKSLPTSFDCLRFPEKTHIGFKYNRSEVNDNNKELRLQSGVMKANVQCAYKSRTIILDLIRGLEEKITTVPSSFTTVSLHSSPNRHQTTTSTTLAHHNSRPAYSTENPAQGSSPELTTHHVPPVSSSTFDTSNPKNKSAERDNNSSGDDSSSSDDHENRSDGWWLILCGVVVLVILVAAPLWLAISYRKRRQAMKYNSSDLDYQTLPEHCEGPMMTPSQWDLPDDITYSHPTIENRYTTLLKRNITKDDPTYAVPRDSLNNSYQNTAFIRSNYAILSESEPGYASVQNIEPAYAAVQNSVAKSEPYNVHKQTSEHAYAVAQKAISNVLIKNINTIYANQNSTTSKQYRNQNAKTFEQKYAVVQRKPSNVVNNNSNSQTPSGRVSNDRCQNMIVRKLDQNEISAKTEHTIANSGYSPPTQVTENCKRYYANFDELQNETHEYVNTGLEQIQVEPAYCELEKKL